jgi:hypothetical protein
VLAAIQIIEKGGSQQIIRNKTVHDTAHDDLFV